MPGSVNPECGRFQQLRQTSFRPGPWDHLTVTVSIFENVYDNIRFQLFRRSEHARLRVLWQQSTQAAELRDRPFHGGTNDLSGNVCMSALWPYPTEQDITGIMDAC